MSVELHTTQEDLYAIDYVRWVETTLAQLRARDYASVDWENLLEEIEDMSRRERQSLESNMVVVFLHLLKWQYQPDFRSGSWKGSLREHRRRVNKALQNSPSLKPYLYEILAGCYLDARAQAADETGLPPDTFPVECIYTVEEILNPEFLPE